MVAIAHELRASYAFVERNFNLVKRYWGWEVAWLIYSVAHSIVIGFIGLGMERLSGQPIDTGQLVLFLLVGSLVWSYLAVVFEAVGDAISWERWEGTIEYTFMAPVSRLTHLVGTCLFAVVYGLLRTGIILAVIGLFFHLDLSRANLLAAAVVLAVASLSFVGLGIVVSVLPLLYAERGAQMVFLAQACLLLFSGVYYPIDVMPGWMQAVATVSPATYALGGVREALLHGRGLTELGGALLPLALIGIVSIPLGVRVFVVAEQWAKRTGRLKRSG
jgi:ABC-2 type transport system permease protein